MTTKKKTKVAKPSKKTAEMQQIMAMLQQSLSTQSAESSQRGFRDSLFFGFLNQGMKPVEAANKVAMTAKDLWVRLHGGGPALSEAEPKFAPGPMPVIDQEAFAALAPSSNGPTLVPPETP